MSSISLLISDNSFITSSSRPLNLDCSLIQIASSSLVIPVGLAYEIAYAENPKIKLHHPDGTHPGMLGTYLGACTVFAMITNSSPEGLFYDYLDRVTDGEKAFLQKVAWKAYLQNKDLIN